MKRLYSLFEKRGFRYHRVSQLAYPKPTAVRVFQNALLAGPAHHLRPVNDTWKDGQRVYDPAVEQMSLGVLRPGDLEFHQKQLEPEAKHIIPARCRTYRTGQVSK